MKRIPLYIISVLLIAATGCKKFLDKDPDSNRAVIETPEQLSQLLISAYPKWNYLTAVEAMSDNAADKGAGTEDPTNEACYKFEVPNANVDKQDSPDGYWAAAYKAIASCNEALDIINKSANPAAFSAQKGEALMARAYAHFMLVNLYSPFYEPGNANDGMGVPYVDVSEDVTIKKYDRKTVAHVYQKIQEDIEAGLPLIADKIYEIPQYHFTKAAAYAFAARFYLYKKEYQKVVEMANSVTPASDILLLLRPWNTTWAPYSYQELWSHFSKATTASNLLLVETSSVYGRYSYTYRFGYTNPILNQVWPAKRICGNPLWIFETKVFTAGTGNYLIPKLSEYFKANSINANFGQPYVMLPLFDAEEVLFNRAEANAYLGKYTDVLVDLNKYVQTRAQNYNAANHMVTEARIAAYAGSGVALKDAYTKAVLDLKRVEYMYQGMRWFDMQRYKVPVTHSFIAIAGDPTSATTITVPYGDNRRVLQIPVSAKLSGISLNPR